VTDSFSNWPAISRAWPPDLADLPLGALAPGDGLAARHQEVAAVAVGDLDDVAGLPEPGHLTGEDELHVPVSSQRAVEV
jgi:hypothetical protein